MKRVTILRLCMLISGFVYNGSVFAQKQKSATPSKETVSPGERQQPIAKEIRLDRNFDGIVDRLESYDDKGVITRIEADTNDDGKMNEWFYFEDGIRNKAERDSNGDGKPDTFMTYDKKGIIQKVAADTTGDGKVNEWVYYKKR